MQEELHIKIRNLEVSDYPQLKRLMDRIYTDLGGAWPRHTIEKLIQDFPDGQVCVIDHDDIVGVALSLQVDYDRFSNPHTYDELISQRMTILNNPHGDALYGLDVLIDPDYRGYRLGRRLYEVRKELCRQQNLRAILAGGRIPNFHQYVDEMSAADYLEAVKRREIYDPILTFQLSNDFQLKRLLKKYLPEDEKSQGYATLLEWNNIFYEPPGRLIESRKTQIRVGAVQWQMRQARSVDEVLQQVEYFVDALSDYKSDFALFPEFFNAPLMGLCDNKSNQTEAIRFLAGFTERFRQEMSNMAVSYNINIITGSMPLLLGDDLFNVSYLCRRDGTVDMQSKIHITPHERRDWVIQGGDTLQVFQTDAGRVGILICYDVEFPELSRLLAEQDMDVLFVPFWTDTKNGYLRVRHCAQARAIEDECYVVICGSCGNLPSVDNLDVQYAQSAVFSPSDFAFPHDAVMSETTPNTEMLMFSDLDLDRLTQIRNEGSVTNLKDRRHDLYQVSWLGTSKPKESPSS
ncbi:MULTISPECIES: carbon-nitrogen hydrolase family protein [Alkalimonas]|uniref:Carbon-nitrogen hydrolase family protein n=1 Tax=Alkalimonas mucilaginosa TaxID=3057676 RepID=A0ABU7JHU3_9GAMM|nr:carbon-nitrogen hydrolase family protein [Alkalimonas sp. MEB004]MEE2024918.1 carbon-nitrogen hydrolase family protein [Alkalimonas sp. MEB004]